MLAFFLIIFNGDLKIAKDISIKIAKCLSSVEFSP